MEYEKETDSSTDHKGCLAKRHIGDSYAYVTKYMGKEVKNLETILNVSGVVAARSYMNAYLSIIYPQRTIQTLGFRGAR